MWLPHRAGTARPRARTADESAPRPAPPARGRPRPALAPDLQQHPLDQPILAGHHSQPHHERDLARLHDHQNKALKASRVAADADRPAHAALAAGWFRHNPVVVGNRLDRLGAKLRRDQRALVRHREGTDSPTGTQWDQRTRTTLTLERIADMVRGGLPASAYTRKTWWANEIEDRHAHAHAWTDNGWHVSSVNLERGTVTFVRPNEHSNGQQL